MQVPALRAWREKRVLSMRELSARSGVAHTTVFKLEHGHGAQPATIRKLAKALDITPERLTKPA